MNILQINASARADGNSTRVANDIVARLRAAHPHAELVVRDLGRTPPPVVDEAALTAFFVAEHERTPEQAARVAVSDQLIAEVKQADVLVLGVPMYNFGNSIQLKSWIDALCRNGTTFRYTENGPVGLLTDKTVYVGFARGGRYRGTEQDSQTPYLKTVLGFIGLTDVRFVYAEGLNMGPDAAAQGFAEAEQDIAQQVQ